MNKKNLKNYWISPLIIIIGIFFFNTTSADVKVKASQQVSNFLNTIKEFVSEKDSLIKIKRSEELLDMLDLEFMSKATDGKQLRIMKKLCSKENFLTNLYNLSIYISKILKKLNFKKNLQG